MRPHKSEEKPHTYDKPIYHSSLTARHGFAHANQAIVGASVIHALDDLKQRREQEVAFLLVRLHH